MRAPLAAVLALALSGAHAEWAFEAPVPVSGPAAAKVFHHLEAAGRQSLAVSAGTVAVVWEDNRTGTPQVYLALRAPGAVRFEEQALAPGAPAYEPAVVALPEGRFVIAWEQDGAVRARTAGPDGQGPLAELAPAGAHATLAGGASDALYAAWGEQAGRFRRIVVARLQVAGDSVKVLWRRPVEARAPQADQLYPALAPTRDGVAVAWEDRRAGHTRLYYSRASREGEFAPPQPLNELPPPMSAVYGRGTGVTRVALASDGAQQVVAVWMDKREFQGGYDVYAALSRDGGRSFGPNEKVQDVFGENIPQWHPAVALGRGGSPVVAWDDPRDETADVWYSWRGAQGWSDDRALPGAAGEGEQSEPVLAVDERGRLHAAWVSRQAPNGPTRIWYTWGAIGESADRRAAARPDGVSR